MSLFGTMTRAGALAGIVLAMVPLLTGCATPAPVSVSSTGATDSTPVTQPVINPDDPLALQLPAADPELRRVKYSSLLHFEAPSDTVFTTIDPAGASSIDTDVAFTGRASLRLDPSTRKLTFRLPALLGTRPFPGTWNLIGPYLRSGANAGVVLTYQVDGVVLARRSVVLNGDTWTQAWLDVSMLAEPSPGQVQTPANKIGELVIEPASGLRTPIWVDDLLLVENAVMLVDTTPTDSTHPWTIRRQGYRVIGDAPGRFKFTMQSTQANADGWALVEANAMRARFESTGKQKRMTVYADGRAYWDGQFKPMSKLGAYEAQLVDQHRRPGAMSVVDDRGRVDRTSDGDADNDGYNESTGAYRIVANGPRIEVRISPKDGGLVRPVLEISGLPEGDVLATIEGRLVDKLVRTEQGHLLVDLPVRIDRETTVNVRVQ